MKQVLRLIIVFFLITTAKTSLGQLKESRTNNFDEQLESLRTVVSLRPDSGITILREIKKEAEAQQDLLSQAKSLTLIAWAYLLMLELDSSIINYKEAEVFVKASQLTKEAARNQNEHAELLWDIHKGLLEDYTKLYQEDSANHYLNKLEVSPRLNLGGQEKKAGLIYMKCYLNYKMENYKECIQYGLEILDIKRDTSKQLLIYEVNTKMLLAKTFIDLEDILNAQKYFEQCLKIETLNRIPARFTNSPKYSYAIFLMENADNPILGGDSSKQVPIFKKAKQLLIELNVSPNLTAYNRALYSNGMAEALFYDNRYDSAIVYHRKALKFSNEKGYRIFSANVILNISLCFFENNELDSSLYNALKGLEIMEEEKNVYYLRFGYRVLYQIYEKQGKFNEALTYYKRHVEMNDSLSREEELVKISDLESTFELGQREQDLVFKEKELELLEEVSQSKSKTILIFGGGLIAVLLLSIFLFRSNREKKIINGFLVEKQDIIEENLKEKEALLREVHHRVKNNLQVISGMLQLQADKIDDPRVDEVMQEGQERIKSMAIIHQCFYEGEELRDISFGDYLRELTKEISAFYGSKEFIQLHIEDNKERFNIDTSIPLGIIVNELISNAYKHAFTFKEKGEIAVQLLQRTDGLCSLIIKDNGVGLPDKFNIEETQSMGLKLVRILIKQIRGELEYLNNGGAEFIITFPSK
ncbi:MAG: sensor histidine kinase [Flavobacteriales bacterium]|nr:sensor histidine kinase [Flavobacteriales bacterium]